jgi:hypothetical protein
MSFPLVVLSATGVTTPGRRASPAASMQQTPCASMESLSPRGSSLPVCRTVGMVCSTSSASLGPPRWSGPCFLRPGGPHTLVTGASRGVHHHSGSAPRQRSISKKSLLPRGGGVLVRGGVPGGASPSPRLVCDPRRHRFRATCSRSDRQALLPPHSVSTTRPVLHTSGALWHQSGGSMGLLHAALTAVGLATPSPT